MFYTVFSTKYTYIVYTRALSGTNILVAVIYSFQPLPIPFPVAVVVFLSQSSLELHLNYHCDTYLV